MSKEDDENELRAWIQDTVDMLVSDPSAIRTDVMINGAGIQVRVTGPCDELSKVVGVNGLTSSALARLIRAAGYRYGVRKVYIRTKSTDTRWSKPKSNGTHTRQA